jgi:ATP-dependent Lhr-like helicase
VIFRDLLERETGAPRWWELLQVYRRLEARGELRGGRFVQGFAGEQFALPEALSALRDVRKQPKTGELTVINCADPLNLSGIITPGERIPSISGQRMIYRDGVPLAFGQRDKVTYLESMDAEHQWRLQWALMGK